MKKFYTTLLLALACVASASAQEYFTVTANGKTVSPGETIICGYEINEVIPGLLSMVEWRPMVQLESEENLHITAIINSEGSVNCCIGSNCDTTGALHTLTKDFEYTPDNDIVWKNFIYVEARIESETTISNAACEAEIEIYPDYEPSDGIKFTIKFVDEEASGIKTVGSDAQGVKVQGRKLTYKVGSATRLSIYSVLGQPVVERTVKGTGTISLDKLPQGLYLYRLGQTSGKFMVK
ncbi:MAG: T9SS type A sorting domain-containing protein [Bacteroidales bacterium]|nr:T9SS type A sorting domain-containing protein [Bacteroidales bacterium]